MDAETDSAKVKAAEAKASSTEDDGPKYLDLAFGMDCTGSMGSYINQAQQNIRTIVEQIVANERADVKLALVEYRDHPPQDRSFVTRVHDFTGSVRTMKEWLDACRADGGGDAPEAVADGLHQILKLSWREEATKICVFISDAPPHGLKPAGDGFPNGCPDGLDPMQIAGQLAEKGVTLYMVGCEPSIVPYKDWFMAIADKTGGQYVPLKSAGLLSNVIIGGAQEEMSLKKIMEEVNKEVQKEASSHGGKIDYEELTTKVYGKLNSSGYKSKQLHRNKEALPMASGTALKISDMDSMEAVRHHYETIPEYPEATTRGGAMRSAPSVLPAYAMAAPPGAPPGAEGSSKEMFGEDIYALVEDDISVNQASRMVQKSLAMNNLKSRVTRSEKK